MKHQKIQKKFLLYIDGDLSEAEKLLIDMHLDECGDCKRHFEELATIWNQERTLEKPMPSPALWYELKDRMEKENFKEVPALTMITNGKLLLNMVIKVTVVVFAVFIGSMFGNALTPNNSVENLTYADPEIDRDEFGMSYFDAMPPNSIATDLLEPITAKGLQK